MRRRLASLLGLGAVLSAAILWLVAAPIVSAGDPCYHGFEMPKATTVGGDDHRAHAVRLHPDAHERAPSGPR